MNDIPLYLTGNVVTDVSLRFSKNGDAVASFRLAVGTRRFDKTTQQWVDSGTHFLDVSCWRALAANVVESITKGMPVLVIGRVRTREVQRPCGDSSHVVRYFDVEATSVGPDLARGTARFQRVKRDSVIRSEQRAIEEAMNTAGPAA